MSQPAKHTPGQWTAKGRGIYASHGWRTDGGSRVACVDMPKAGDKSEALANATLIAAAPTMLDALKDVLAAQNAYDTVPYRTESELVLALERLKKAKYDACAIIAKAEGKA